MASSLWSRSVKHSPAAVSGYGLAGRVRPIYGGSTCRFGSKPPATNASLRASSLKVPPLPCSAPSSTVATANRPLPPPSPPSDLATSPVPLLLIPPILVNKDEYQVGENDEDPYIFYSPSKKEIVTVEKNQSSWRRDEIRDAYWIGSSKGWVMFMNRNDCNIYLCNPFSPTTSPIIPLPPIETLPCVTSRHFRRRRLEPDEPEPTSHELDFEFVMEGWYNINDPDGPNFEGNWDGEKAKSYREEKTKKKWFEVPLLSPFEPNIVPSKDLIEKGFIYKMVLSCSPPSPSNNYTNECMVAIIYGSRNALAICRLGDSSWTRLDGEFYSEMSFSRHDNSCLYTWDYDNYEFKSCDLSIPKSPEWNSIIILGSSRIVWEYLVESEPGNLLVVGNVDGNKEMEVYKVDTAKKTHEKLKSLDDQALFVGAFSETMLVPATELPPLLKSNCIYFTNFDYFHMGLFDLEKRVVNYQFEGLNLDLYSLEEQFHGIYERPEFRKKGEGWPVWVMPNPW